MPVCKLTSSGDQHVLWLVTLRSSCWCCAIATCKFQVQAHLPAEVTEGQAVQLLGAELEVLRSFVLINLMLSPAACVFQVPAIAWLSIKPDA